MDVAEYRTRSYEVWQRMAAGWERHREWVWDVSRKVSDDMIARLEPEPGQTVLELACGTGETGFAAASLLGPDGSLISTDFAPEMVYAARRRAEQLGLTNVEVREMDAERMDLPDDSVDGVLCRFGYMLMADPGAAFAESRRVLRDGGRLSFSVWGAPERNPWAAAGGGALVQLGHMPMPQPGDPGIFGLADPRRIEELVRAAGFGAPDIREVEITYRFRDFDEYWRFLGELAGAVAMVLAQLSGDQRAEVRAAIERNVEGFRRDGGGYVMPGVAVNAVTS